MIGITLCYSVPFEGICQGYGRLARFWWCSRRPAGYCEEGKVVGGGWRGGVWLLRELFGEEGLGAFHASYCVGFPAVYPMLNVFWTVIVAGRTYLFWGLQRQAAIAVSFP